MRQASLWFVPYVQQHRANPTQSEPEKAKIRQEVEATVSQELLEEKARLLEQEQKLKAEAARIEALMRELDME
jgi:hypothetical protein